MIWHNNEKSAYSYLKDNIENIKMKHWLLYDAMWLKTKKINKTCRNEIGCNMPLIKNIIYSYNKYNKEIVIQMLGVIADNNPLGSLPSANG